MMRPKVLDGILLSGNNFRVDNSLAAYFPPQIWVSWAVKVVTPIFLTVHLLRGLAFPYL